MSSTDETEKRVVGPASRNSVREKGDKTAPSNEAKTGETDTSTAESVVDRYPNPSRRTFLRGSALVVGSAVFSGQASGTEHDGDGPVREIDSCTEITEPGHYVLRRDLEASGTCISIDADDVLLDGAGHTVSGSGTGISVGDYEFPGFSNVTIENLTITGFWEGIYFANTFDSQIRNVTVEQCSYGLWFDQSDTNDIRESEFSNNDQAIHVTETSTGNVFRSNTVTNNGGGIGIHDAGTDTQLIGNTVTDNARNGIYIANFSNGCRVIDNVSKNNGGHGFEVTDEVTNVRLEGNLAQGNGENGIDLYWADGNPIIGNEIRENAGAGIEFTSSRGVVRANTIADNENGIVLSGRNFSTNSPLTNEFTYNNIEGNNEFGIDNKTDLTVVATCNYWGHETGPVHQDNPESDPKGDRVSDNVEYIPWSVTPIRDGEGTCIGGTELPPVGDFENSPTDPDRDSKFEDVNGDGEFDVIDVQALFANRDDSTIRGNPKSFDFNDDGKFNIVDVQSLFNKLVKGS